LGIIRFIRACLLASLITLSCGAAVVVAAPAVAGAATAPAAAAATTGPSCTFNGSKLPLVKGVSGGSKIAVSCTGLAPLHPYMLVGTSLVLAVDPAAAPLLKGQILSLSGLTALLNALTEIDLPSAILPFSDLFGNLNVSWTVPTFQPLDPNASCPPSQEEFNSGLLGCAMAMIDLTSFKPVGAGSALFEYAGSPLFPPKPTLALSTKTAAPGQTVSVKDATGASTYWWLSTLSTLTSALGTGAGASPKATVTLKVKGGATVTESAIAQASSATYSSGVFTPPVLSGSFKIPTGVSGLVSVTLKLAAPFEGVLLGNSASAGLLVSK